MRASPEKREYWEQHLLAWQDSGLSQLAYCVQAGITYSTFKNWRSRLIKKSGSQTPGFVEAKPVDAEKTLSSALSLQISLANGCRIAVSTQASPEIVRQVLILAGSGSCSV